MLRHWLASLLPRCPAQADIAAVATELAANAIRHTKSGTGGSFSVALSRRPGVIWIAVADEGGGGEPRVIEEPGSEAGRGLLVVRALSLRTGVAGDDRGRTVWAEVASPGEIDPAGKPAAGSDGLLTVPSAAGPIWLPRPRRGW